MSPKKTAANAAANKSKVDQSQLIDGKYSIKDLVDLDRLRAIFESFSQTTGFTTGLLSYPDLEILIGTGWREICIKYHRACPEAEKFCKLSNQNLLGDFKEARQLGILPCENGLVDGATPVIVRGKHLASLTTGQVLFEKPDIERFKRQAKEFGFDEAEYLLALSKVPVVTAEQLKNALVFLSGIAVEIAEQGLDHLLLKETADKLENEVAERGRTEASLKAAEARYQALIEQVPAIIYTDSAEQYNKTLYISPQVKTITGYTAEQWMADNELWLKFMHPDDRQRVMEEYVSATRAGGPFISEYRINTQDGRLVWVHDQAILIRDSENKPSFWQGLMLDISEEKRAELALHESEEKYRSLVERASDGILIIQDGLVKYVNPHLAQMRGQSADEIIGTRFEAYIHPDERPTISERYRRRVAGEEVPATYETVLQRADHSKVYVELSAGIVSYDGKPADLIVVRDVNERKEAENIQNAIYEIARSVISTGSLDELYRVIHLALEQILPVDNFYIALYDPRQNLLSFPYFVDQYDAPTPTQTPGHGLTEYVLRTRKPLLATAQVFARLLEQGEVEPVGTDSVDWLGVPLIIGEKVIGVMVIQTYTDSVRLEQRDLDIMSFVSTQVAIAIERVRAEQATSQRTKELKALYDISLDIISTHDLPTLLDTIVERAVRLLEASAGGLYLCDAERREVRCVVSYHTLNDYRGTVLKYGEGAAGIVAETEKPLKIDDYRSWAKRAPVFDQEKPFRALISVPIVWQGEVQGVLHVLDNQEDRRFEDANLELLAQFANQAAVAIENARLLTTEREQHQRESALLALMRLVGSTLNLEEVMRLILQHLLKLVPCESGSVQLLEGEALRTAAAVGFEESSGAQGRIFPLRDFPLNRQVVEQREPLYIEDICSDSRYVYVPGLDQARSFLGVPLISKEKVIGIITLDSQQVAHFKPADIELALAVANHASTALENARLYEEVQLYASDLESRVAERTVELSGRIAQVEELNRAMADLLQDLQETNRRLEETSRKLQTANTELETFAYSVSHDLKAPLRGIDGYSHLLTEQYAGQLDEEGKAFLQNIRRATAHMAQLIDDLLTYSRLELQELTARPVDACLLVEDLLAERRDEIERRKIQVTVEIPFKFVTCDAEGLAQALRNLLDNALKFTRETPEVQIQIGGRKTTKSTLLWVRDNGVGFDLKYHDRIFEMFQRLYTSDAYPGTGIGLSIVRKVTQRMGGRAWAESELGKGATFYLEFPIEKSHRRESNP
jgi:PAS domain S-box-containing protein